MQIWSCVRLLTMPIPSSGHTLSYTPRLLWSSVWSSEEGWYEPCPGLAHENLPQEEMHVLALQTWKPHTDEDRATKRKEPGPQNLPLEEHPRNITLDSTWVKNKSVLFKPLKMWGFFMTLPSTWLYSVSSVQSLSHVWLFATPWIASRQASLSITNSWSLLKPMPSSRWCYPAISSSVVPFSSGPQSLPASGSFPMSQLFTWGGQSIGVSALVLVVPMNTQDWSPLGWTGWISLQLKGLSRVVSNTTVQKHQFFGAQLSS